ncbi:MAG: DUF1003 domain-containing protein [Candidatus Gracilibacteria bacterium]|jgi:uncharacterized membrane protein
MIKDIKALTQKFIDPTVHDALLKKKKAQIKSFKMKMSHDRTLTDRLADSITKAFGSTWFFIVNFVWFAGWMIINMDLVPFLSPFDPYPFGFLTMMVSLEAIFLSIFVLISQNRASKVADLREEIDLQINVQAEQEITRILCMVDEIHDHLGLEAKDDAELKKMKKRMNLSALEKAISKEMEE